MGLAKNYGVHFQMRNDDQVKRAKQLEQMNARKYEVFGFRFCYVPLAGEGDVIMNWVLSGDGVMPSPDLPKGW